MNCCALIFKWQSCLLYCFQSPVKCFNLWTVYVMLLLSNSQQKCPVSRFSLFNKLNNVVWVISNFDKASHISLAAIWMSLCLFSISCFFLSFKSFHLGMFTHFKQNSKWSLHEWLNFSNHKNQSFTSLYIFFMESCSVFAFSSPFIFWRREKECCWILKKWCYIVYKT